MSARRHAPPNDGSDGAPAGAVFIGVAKVFFMLSGFVQQVLLARFVSGAEYGAFGAVNSAISIVNNTVVQATIQGVSKFTAEDDARAGAVQRAGLRMQAVWGRSGAGLLPGRAADRRVRRRAPLRVVLPDRGRHPLAVLAVRGVRRLGERAAAVSDARPAST